MAQVIDALVLELGFDTKDLEKGKAQLTKFFKEIGEGADKSGKKVTEGAKNQEVALNKLRNEVVALFGLFTAGRGLKEFIADVTSTNAALGRFTDMLGLNTRDFARWQAGASLLGVPASDIASSFKNLTTEIQRFSLTGQSSVLPWFRMLGIQFTDLRGNAKDAGELFLELADKVKGMNHARATTILEQMGISQGMIQVILQGRGAVQALLDKEKEYADIQARDAPFAKQRLMAWMDLRNTLSGIAADILTRVTPALVSIASAISDWFKTHPDLGRAIVIGLAGAIGILTAAISIASAVAIPAMIAGLAGIEVAGGPLLLTLGLIAAAITSIVEVSEHWNEIWGDIQATANNKATGVRKVVDFMLGPAAFLLPKPEPYTPPPPSGGAAPAIPKPPAAPTRGPLPVGIRNNNPGNLRSWGGAPVVGGFATFSTAQEGISASAGNLMNYAQRGWDTPRAIAEHWTATKADQAAYAAAIAKAAGVKSVDDHLNLRDPSMAQKVLNSIFTQENGYNPYSQAQVNAGLTDRLMKYSSSVASAQHTTSVANNTSNHSNTVSVGQVIFQVQPGQDGASLARDFHNELTSRNAVAQQANGGPT